MASRTDYGKPGDPSGCYFPPEWRTSQKSLSHAGQPSADHQDLLDKIEGLEADLREAVRVAYRRGAVEWVELNYPAWAVELKASSAAVAPTPSES